jgi:hypothetical protein
MIRTNETKLVEISVLGMVSHPEKSRPYIVSSQGEIKVFPGTGGITYNKRVGDICIGLMADHVEPGVSIKNIEKSPDGGSGYNMALNVLACCGNEAIVITGDAKGKKGVVVGKHGGIEHVLVDFPPNVMDKLVIGDKIQIRAIGAGLELIDFPMIKVMNISPKLLKAMMIKETKRGLKIGVTHIIPAKIMGSGLGRDDAHSGDYDIQLFDKQIVKEYHLEDLRFGDLVAICDADSSYGRIYKTGAMTIGIIVHSDCYISGHGPGVTTLLTTSTRGIITPFINKKANIANLLKL